jgi:hypothetical protein
MKKLLIISFLLLIALGINAQGKEKDQKSAPKDSITAVDIQKHKYLLSIDVMEFNQMCYRDSIDIREFYGKPLGGYEWKTKLQYYWSMFEPLPSGVKYLHRRFSGEGFLEYLSTKYSR